MQDKTPVSIRADFRMDGVIAPLMCVFKDGRVAIVRKIHFIEKHNIGAERIKLSYLCSATIEGKEQYLNLEFVDNSWFLIEKKTS